MKGAYFPLIRAHAGIQHNKAAEGRRYLSDPRRLATDGLRPIIPRWIPAFAGMSGGGLFAFAAMSGEARP